MTPPDPSTIIASRTIDPSTHRRAAAFAALGEPARLAIVEHLSLTDRTPSELSAALGIGSNLMAHHLDVLARSGLVARRRSDGDARRRYVTLGPDVPHGVVVDERIEVARVVFVCRHNAARSPFAAGLWAARSDVPATSAGAAPRAAVHPLAVEAAARFGVDLRHPVPQGYETATGTVPTLVVSVCDVAWEDDPPLVAARRLHWSTPDPIAHGGLAAFEAAFAAIEARITRLAAVVALPGAHDAHG